MDSKLSSTQAELQHDRDVALLTLGAEEVRSRLAQVGSDPPPHTAGFDFSAGPRVTEPSLDVTLRPAELSNDPLLTDRPSLGRRAVRSLARFVVAACIGVIATLAWQSYGGTARQTLANWAPQLGGLLSPPAMNLPSGSEMVAEQPSLPAIPASAPQAASAQAAAVAPTASETAASNAPTAPSPELQQLETIVHDLVAVRRSVEQLTAGQEQMARDIAKLQTTGQDIRRRISAPPPPAAITARKPAPPPQLAPQSSAAAPPPPLPERPSRPPASVP